MTKAENDEAARPTPGYLYTLSLACIGLPCIGVGLGGALIGRAGGDPMRAMDTDVVVTFLLGFAVLFSMRLIFLPSASSSLRSFVRMAITLIIVLEIPLSLMALLLAYRLPPMLRNASLPIYFSAFAILCLIPAALWLLRYRKEGI